MRNYSHPIALTKAYANWLEMHLDTGADAYLITFMFKPLPPNKHARLSLMTKEIERTYSKQLTRHLRRPDLSEHYHFPIWIGAPDWPVYKAHKSSLSDVTINGGMHFHMIALVPVTTRMKVSLSKHIETQQNLYCGPKSLIQTLHAIPIEDNTERVVNYVTKSIENGRATQDDILVLPRAHSEMR